VPPDGAATHRPPASPSFLLIGSTKSGTTSLHDWLSRHPDVFMHPWKEMRFFCEAERWSRGVGWYRGELARRGEAAAWGEASNGYTRRGEHPGVPERVAALCPDIRLVYVVRDPMRRLVSHYRHRLATGIEWRGPEEAVRADPAYVETGLYGWQLAAWRAVFPAERILVLQSEALFADPPSAIDRLAAHLGVTPHPELAFRAENAAADRRAVPAGLRRQSALGPLRGAVKRAFMNLPEPLRARAPLSAAPVTLPPDLRADIALRFAEDRRRLEDLAGAEVTRGWAE